ncbi:MAG: hypothetical protein AAGB93_06440 [Planctomycetota bacterium]
MNSEFALRSPSPLFRASAAAAALGVSFAAASALEVLRFAPSDGSEVERTATWTESSKSTSVDITLGGQPTSEVPTPFTTVERTLEIESTEQFVRSAPGRPLELVRRFGPITLETGADLTLEPAGGNLRLEGEGGSLLEGVGVRFLWNEDEESYERSYADDYEADESLLETLRPTTDFLVLLPEGEDVEVDAAWDVELDALFDLLRPGGTLPIQFESDLQALEGVLDPLLLPGVLQCLEGEQEGEISARVVSIEDGIAAIRFQVEANVVADKADHVGALLGRATPEGAVAEMNTATYSTSIDGKGTLEWDLAESRMASFRFEAAFELEIEIVVEAQAEGQEIEFVMEEEREGTISLVVE